MSQDSESRSAPVGRIPPQNLDAERSVLGGVLLDSSAFDDVQEIVKADDFYREAQKTAVPLTGVHTNKVAAYTLVHCAESRADFGTNRLWDSMWWWYKGLAEFHLKWEMAHLSPEQQEQMFPLMSARARGEFDIEEFDREDMVIARGGTRI